ncbi:hypothetical protein L2E82_45920 [Cichorium intybus]|uniref:Uncharacterized protein n=1 Tax=Cichorium intybus TaxID=13427 RepID=A0ACB8ZU90_CICIN|nr:hypothetical protein L2E82_45920 [Cichorium intybus]
MRGIEGFFDSGFLCKLHLSARKIWKPVDSKRTINIAQVEIKANPKRAKTKREAHSGTFIGLVDRNRTDN